MSVNYCSTGYPAPPSTNLNQREIMLSFAYLAYTGEGITTANPCPQILEQLNTSMAQIPPLQIAGTTTSAWEIVWGPVAYTVPGAIYQDNMMFIAKNTEASGTPQYVLAIRGTNFASEVDWLVEDFNVVNTVCWPLASTTPSAGAMISESASIDMNILLYNMTDSVTTQLSLIDFLSSITSEPINICVTGHSLGGMLASTMALYLLENQSTWDNSNNTASTVAFVSFAAPTAGNAAFAAYSNTMFQNAARPLGTSWDSNLNTNGDVVQCSLDIAPYFYTSSNIYTNSDDDSELIAGPLFSIYNDTFNFSNLVLIEKKEWEAFQSTVLAGLAALTLNNNYTQLATCGPALTGVYNGPGPASSTFSDYLGAFVSQAIWQHSNSYPNIFNLCQQLLDPAIIVRNSPFLTSITPAGAKRLDSEPVVPISISGYNLTGLSNLFVYAGPWITVSNPPVLNEAGDTLTTSFVINKSKAYSAPLPVSVTVSGISGIGTVTSSAVVFTIEYEI